MENRNIALLAAAISVIGANSLALAPIASAVAASFPGAEGPDVLAASASYGLATAASALVLAPRAGRIGAARTASQALAALGLALLAAGAAPSLALLIAAQAGAGLAAGAAIPAIYARAAELAAPGREAQVMGRVLVGWTLSMVFGVSISALIADLAHWRVMYVLLGALAAFLAARLWTPARPQSDLREGAAPVRALRDALTPQGAALLGAAGLFMTAFYGLYSYLGAHLIGVLGFSTAGAGAASLLYGLGFGAATLLDGVLDRLGARRALPLALAATLGVYAAFAFLTGAPALLLALCPLWGVANHAALTTLLNRLASIDPPRRAALLGLNSAITYLAVFAGALGFRPLFEGLGLAACAAAASALVAVAAVLSVARTRPKPACHNVI